VRVGEGKGEDEKGRGQERARTRKDDRPGMWAWRLGACPGPVTGHTAHLKSSTFFGSNSAVLVVMEPPLGAKVEQPQKIEVRAIYEDSPWMISMPIITPPLCFANSQWCQLTHGVHQCSYMPPSSCAIRSYSGDGCEVESEVDRCAWKPCPKLMT
jgi:hypothetical protein